MNYLQSLHYMPFRTRESLPDKLFFQVGVTLSLHWHQAQLVPGVRTKALNRFFLGHSIISIMEEENLIIIDLIRLIRQIQLIRLIRLIRLIQFIRLIQLIQLIRVIKFFK